MYLPETAFLNQGLLLEADEPLRVDSLCYLQRDETGGKRDEKEQGGYECKIKERDAEMYLPAEGDFIDDLYKDNAHERPHHPTEQYPCDTDDACGEDKG